MKIELSRKTTQFLQSKADELGISKEDLARSLLEEFCKVKVESLFREEYPQMSLGQLRILSGQGDLSAQSQLRRFARR